MKIRIASILTLFFLMAACSVNPVTGKKEVMFLSEENEIALGKQSDPQITAMYGLYEDEKMQQFINAKGNEMAAISHRAHLKYEFKILDSPIINAFALPGGYVYFTRGIMAHFNNEAEFAGVLGHEIGHITARHSAKQYTNAQLAQVLLIGGLIVSKELRGFANELSQGVQLLFLKFGRDNESESDQLGVEYSTKIGYDAHHMANFFQTLNRKHEESGAGEIPTFLSTHPHPLDRFNKVHQAAEKWQSDLGKTDLSVNRNQYLKMIDGIIYGDDPRQGYVDNNIFFHPDLRFQYPIPANWRTINMPTQVQMAPEDGKAMMLLTVSNAQSLEAAAQASAEQYQLETAESQRTRVNGLSALAVVSTQTNPQDPNQVIKLLSYYIDYNNLIYVFHGVSTQADFNTYYRHFTHTMKGFRVLKDPRRINVKPERIKIQTVSRSMTLSQAFTQFRISSERHEELAVVNGMQLSDPLKAGDMIKVVSK